MVNKLNKKKQIRPKAIYDCRKAPMYILVILLLVIFTVEIVLMIILEDFTHDLDSHSHIILDSVLLVIIVFPALFYLVYRPLKSEIEKNKKEVRKFESAHDMLITVLDSLDAIVYVADIKTYELIFLNKFARNIFGDVTGEICWQTLQTNQTGPCGFCSNKYLISEDNSLGGMYEWELQNTVNGKWYDIRDRAIRWNDGRIVRLEIATDVTVKKKSEKEKEELIGKLESALEEIDTLRGIIPICSYCKKIRTEEGSWNMVEQYIAEHSSAEFSHSICPDCADVHYSEFNLYNKK